MTTGKKVKRTPEQRLSDLQRALTLAPTGLARAIIRRALERLEAEQSAS